MLYNPATLIFTNSAQIFTSFHSSVLFSVTKLFGVAHNDSANLADEPVFSSWLLSISWCLHLWLVLKRLLLFLHVMLNAIFGRLLVNICSRWWYLCQCTSNCFVFFDLLQTSLGLGDAFIWLTSLTFNTRTWSDTLTALLSWQILALSSSSHFPTSTPLTSVSTNRKLQQQRKWV